VSIVKAVHGVILKIKNYIIVEHVYSYYSEISWVSPTTLLVREGIKGGA
jgi:hypothetical protein